MKVLITGGAGFIGSHTCDYFVSKGCEVIVIDDLSHGKRENLNPAARFYNTSICDASAMEEIFSKERPSLLIHLAAQIKVPESIQNPAQDAEINIIGTINLLEAGRKNGLQKIIYAASAAIFGEPEYLPIDEGHPLNMISGYGVSKHTAEHYLSVYYKLYGISYVSLRYANVFGPRQDSTGEGGVISIFAERFSKNMPPVIFGDGEQIRDFVYVKDVARANFLAAVSDYTGILNVCTNQKTSVNKLVAAFHEIYGKPLPPIYEPPRCGDILVSYMSYSRIESELGWKPAYALKEALKETVEYY